MKRPDMDNSYGQGYRYEDSPIKGNSVSQNQRSKIREKHYNANILKKITAGDKSELIGNISYGQNKSGGNWGALETSSIEQKYNHSQKDAMIIRGP